MDYWREMTVGFVCRSVSERARIPSESLITIPCRLLNKAGDSYALYRGCPCAVIAY